MFPFSCCCCCLPLFIFVAVARTKANNKGYTATKSCCKPCQLAHSHVSMSPCLRRPWAKKSRTVTFPKSCLNAICHTHASLRPTPFGVRCACVILTAILMKRKTVEIQFVKQSKKNKYRYTAHQKKKTTKKSQKKFVQNLLGVGDAGGNFLPCQQPNKMAYKMYFLVRLLLYLMIFFLLFAQLIKKGCCMGSFLCTFTCVCTYILVHFNEALCGKTQL